MGKRKDISCEVNKKMETLKCTRAALSKLINWSTSSYNDRKKDDVIEEIIFLVERGGNVTKEYASGCYSDKADTGKIKCNFSGGYYTLKIENGTARLYNCLFNLEGEPLVRDTAISPDYVVLEKPAQNKYFLPAKRVRYNTKRHGIPPDIYEVENQNAEYFFISFEGQSRCIPKTDCTVCL